MSASVAETAKKTSRAVVGGQIGLPAFNQCAICFRVRPLCGRGVCRSRFCRWVHGMPSVVVMREGRA